VLKIGVGSVQLTHPVPLKNGAVIGHGTSLVLLVGAVPTKLVAFGFVALGTSNVTLQV
jgi:hypothetical protein